MISSIIFIYSHQFVQEDTVLGDTHQNIDNGL